MVRGRVVETDGATDEARSRSASSVPQDLIPLAEVLVGEIEQPHGGNSGRVPQPVPLAVRHEREIARREQPRSRSLDLKPAVP